MDLQQLDFDLPVPGPRAPIESEGSPQSETTTRRKGDGRRVPTAHPLQENSMKENTMGNLPQHMKSTDPEIIATVERRMEAFLAWRKQAFEWAAKITGLPEKDIGIRINGRSNDQVILVGFSPWQVEGINLPGGWTKDPVRPKKNNPIYKDYAKIATYKAEKVPGTPSTASTKRWTGKKRTSCLMKPTACSSRSTLTPLSNAWRGGLSEHWRDMHTNEALGQQRMLARAALAALLGGGDDE